MKRPSWRRCPHVRIRGIYGDEIIFATPGFRRLQCLDCGRHLDGPVSLATHVSINGGIFPAEGYAPKETAMPDYTPTTEIIRRRASTDAARFGFLQELDFEAQFDRWLNAERARVWDEGWDAGAGWPQHDVNPYRQGGGDD